MRESVPVHVMTFDEPDDIHVIDVTNTSIEVVWTSPSDDSVSMFSIYYAKVRAYIFCYFRVHPLALLVQ